MSQNAARYDGEYTKLRQRFIMSIESGGWTKLSTSFIIEDEEKANLIGKNFPLQMGIKLVHENSKQNRSSTYSRTKTSDPEGK